VVGGLSMAEVKVLTLIILGAPFAAFAINGLCTPLRRRGKLSAYLSITGICLSLVASIILLTVVLPEKKTFEASFTWVPFKIFKPISFGFLVDPLSSIMLFIVALVASMVQIYSLGYMSDEEPPSLGRYFTYHSLFAFSMLSLSAANSLLEMYVFWELVGLCSYLLIGFWYKKREAARAAVKAFWVTRFGDVGFAIGMVVLWGACGTFNLKEIFHLAEKGEIAQSLLFITTLLIFFGAMGKSAQFPLHVWLPDAMEGPTPVSALIHAATMVAAGVYLVSRTFPLFELSEKTLTFILYIGSFTAFLAATMALVQEDIKRVLAYSTISQLGYMMTALGAMERGAAFFHLFTHAYFKALLFLAAGSVIHALKTNDIWKMGKLSKSMPITATLFIIGALALSGIPPFSGFFSKDEILSVTYESGHFIPFLFVIVTVFLTAFYMFRVVFVAFFGKKEGEGHPHESPMVMTLPMALLAIFSIIAGFPKESFFSYLGEKVPHKGAGWIAPLSFFLAFFGIFLAYIIYQRESISSATLKEKIIFVYKIIRRKYYLDDIYEGAYRYILLGIATLCGWFDRYIVDGVVNGVSWSTGRVSQILRAIQSGKVQDYLYWVIFGLVILAAISFFYGGF